jgi:radical SAM superfamily enzyme YgiQ (UPF0313 family)
MGYKNFNIMFVFVNDRMRTFIPLSISYLSAALKAADFSTCVFDTSFYREHERLLEEKKKEDAGIFKPVDYSSIGVQLKDGSLIADLLSRVESEKPNLIAFSVFSQAKRLNFKLASAIKSKFPDIPIVFGGIHVNVEPRNVLELNFIDYICLGEGEEALVELMCKLARREGVEDVRNIGWKRNGKLIVNPVRPPQHLDDLPLPDWDSFAPCHQYGPYRGKLLRMALVEFSRTCPFRCAYCGNRVIGKHYKDSGIQMTYRHKSPERWIEELKHFKDNYNTEFLNIVDGTFVAQSEKVLEKVASLYTKKIKLPFFADATVHCLTAKKARLLKEMGCVCVNMGMECGNEEYRRKYLDKNITDDKIVKAFLTARESGLETRSYNIIGLPFETRENIKETVELNRKCKVGSVSISIFMPYEGTKLRELCIEKNLVAPDQDIVGDGTYPIIHNPYLSNEEVMGLYNTFTLYVFAPRKLYPVIKLAEPETEFARQLRKELLVIST